MKHQVQPDPGFLKRVDELMESGMSYEAALNKVYNDDVAFKPTMGEKETIEHEKFMVNMMQKKTA